MGDILNILIVEDEAILALDLTDLIEDCGHTVVGEADCLSGVENLRVDVEPDVALIDMHLADESTGLDVNAYLRKRWPNIIAVFLTANTRMVPPDYAGAHGVVTKPFSRSSLCLTLNFLNDGFLHPPPRLEVPDGLELSPMIAELWLRVRQP